MNYKPPFQSYKDKLDKKKKRSPIILSIISVLLIGSGILLIWSWINGEGGPQISLFQTKTPTSTNTATSPPPTVTPPNTPVPSETLVPSVTPTGTAAAPFEYSVQSGDSLYSIAEKFGVEDIIIMVLNGLTSSDFLTIGQVLIIPNPDLPFPTPTVLPTGLVSGDIIEHLVLPGESVRVIAEKYLSSEEAIVEANQLEDSYLIHPGEILLVPYWLITPTLAATEIAATPTP